MGEEEEEEEEQEEGEEEEGEYCMMVLEGVSVKQGLSSNLDLSGRATFHHHPTIWLLQKLKSR